MDIDIEAILNRMVGAASEATKGDVGEIKDYARQILEDEKKSLQELAEARVAGVIDDDTFSEEIEREKKVVEAEFLAIEIMTVAATQKAVNAAMKAFTDAVKALI